MLAPAPPTGDRSRPRKSASAFLLRARGPVDTRGEGCIPRLSLFELRKSESPNNNFCARTSLAQDTHTHTHTHTFKWLRLTPVLGSQRQVFRPRSDTGVRSGETPHAFKTATGIGVRATSEILVAKRVPHKTRRGSYENHELHILIAHIDLCTVRGHSERSGKVLGKDSSSTLKDVPI